MPRKKPSDPQEIARKRAERQATEQEISRLRDQGARVTLDPSRRIMSAYRSNVFNLLLERRTITPNHHDAALRLVISWAAWKALDGSPDRVGKVDGGSGDQRALVTDRMLRGGREVASAFEAVPAPLGKLLDAFMVATVEEDRPMAWRGIVERVLGITDRNKQATKVAEMCEALRVHYEGANHRQSVAA